jgi:hypothetical protein
MTQKLYRVGVKHKKTGEELKLRVWAQDNHTATHQLVALSGPGCEYRWTGTGPEHDERGNLITREVDADA